MREGWKELKLGEVLEIKHGYGFKGEYFTDEETTEVLVTPGNFLIGGGFKNDKLKFYKGPINENFILKENDVIITMTDLSKMADTLGYSAKIPKNTGKIYLHNQRIGLVSLLNNSFDLNFVYWLLRTNDYQRYIAGSSIGATVKHTSPSKIYTAKVRVPLDINTQQKIATILSAYDDLIENNLKRIKLLEEMAQQTYEEWFVRMRFPGYETAVFDKETGLPEGWEKVKLGEKFGVQSSKRIYLADYTEFGIPFFRGKEITQKSENASINDVLYISTERFLELKSKFGAPKTGDILLTAVGTLGNLYMVQENDGDFYFKDGNLIWINSNNKSSSHFLFFLLQSEIFQSHIRNIAIGSSQKALTIKGLKESEILYPSVNVIKQFDKVIIPISTAKSSLQSQNQRLKEARDILLPRLMSGVISVENLFIEQSVAKIILMDTPKKEASKEFKEAILIAILTERFGSVTYPLGRKRYTKLSYLFHRYSDNKIQDYLRKAAGPYNPKTKYAGPEKIALQNKYIQNWKGEKGTTGFMAAAKIDDAKKYFSNYWQIEDLDWLTKEFKYKSNDELELFATVDNTLMELSKNNVEFTAANVLKIIKSEKEWEAKLERTIFSDLNVERAIGFLKSVLKYDN